MKPLASSASPSRTSVPGSASAPRACATSTARASSSASTSRPALINRIGGNRKRAAGYYAWFRKRGLVSRGNPRTGDLIVWTKKGHIAHIGIYMSGNRAISALTSGVRTHRIGTLDTRFKAYLHVRLAR